MSKQFKPCQGKQLCQENEQGCRTCERSYEEIIKTRELVDELTELAQRFEYENGDEFADYIAKRIKKKLAHASKEE